MSTNGWVGWHKPDKNGERQMWADAAPKIAMALNEAGYPTRFEPFSLRPGTENELTFLREFPPDDVLLRAAELCGVREQMAVWLDSLGRHPPGRGAP